MNGPKTRGYRVAVAVAFGLIGFGVNFLDIEFMEGAPFKISILAGLFFPLVVALAWGWRYGLLSALAGGCQTMWWLWHGDGWGILYSVPVFTSWIVWHGWWAQRRSEGHPWHVSSFAVEIPFRTAIELGFLVVFPWLVSLNPPPWNPSVTWDHVSSAWLRTVTVKHVAEAYILLMSAYVALSLGPVRRFLGLPPRIAQRDTTAIHVGAVLFGFSLWALDALADYLVFPREGRTFWTILLHGTDAHEMFMRSLFVAAAMVAGIVLARMNRSRAELREMLDHRNRALAAIRNVNQLIVREKDPDRLLDEACRLLVESRGYYNAWIVLTADGRPREPFFHAGFDADFAPMTERLRAGDLPICVRATLSSGDIQVKDDPLAQCADCPLSHSYAGRSALALRLEHAGRVFGWMSLSCPARFARNPEEHDLLKEMAGDLAFALWAAETETRREIFARKYAAVLAATSDAVLAVDLDGRITVFNPGAEKMFGCMAEEVLGSPLARFCPEDRLAEQAEMMRRARDTGTVTGYESERLTADGQRIPVEITLDLNTDDRGRPLGINAILRNTTERKRMEEAAKQEQNINQTIIESVPGTFYMLDENGRYARWNAYQRDVIVGKPDSQVATTNALDTIHPDDRSLIGAKIESVLRNGGEEIVEARVLLRGGPAYQWMLMTGRQVIIQGNPFLIGFGIDITERKRAENELRKSESLFRTLVNTIPDLIWLKDADGVYLSCNKRFERFFGASEADIVGKTDHDFVDKDLADFFRENDRKAMAAGGPSSNEEQITFADDGHEAFLETIKSPMFDADGKLIGILGIGRDITERKRAEAALLENEIRYKSAQKMGHVGNWEYNLATGLFWGSDEAKRIYGFDPNQDNFSVDTVETCIPERERVHQALLDLIEKGAEYNLEFQIVPVNSNQPKTIVSLAEVRKDEKGIPVSVVGVIQDITERKRAERELKSREDLLNRIIDESPFATWISDAEGTLQRANPALKRMLNLTDEQLVGQYNILKDPNVERRGLMEPVRSVFEQGRTIHFNLEWAGEDIPDLHLKGASKVHVEATMFPIQGPGGELNNVVLHWIDVTEAKQAEEALARQQRSINLYNRIANVFLTSSRNEVFADVLAVLLKSLDSRFGYFGYIDETGDLVCPSLTRDVWDRCQVAEKSIVFSRSGWGWLWGRSLLEKRTLIANETLRIPEGHVVLENALATPIVYNDTLIGQFVVANKAGGYGKDDRDLLESAAAQTAPILFGIQEEARQKTAQEKLEGQLRQAQKMEAVGRLAGGVAHDFNNMLGIIIGHADMLLDQMGPDQPYHAALTEIRKAGERSAGLTRQLLAFARKQTVAPKVIDLNDTLESMLNMLRRLIGEDIDLAWLPGEAVWPVKIDPSQIDQILANLCVNARDAIAGVGKVTIETGNTVFDEDYCRGHAGFVTGDYAMLAVSDNGCGMDAGTMSHLFEPFFTTKELGKGTGLGLATVYGVVKQNNGFINVYSEPGQGTTIKIYLPRHRAKEAPPPEKVALRPAARGHETILLVEDEPAILKMTTMMLERDGYAVLAAGTPGEAIRLANEHAGDIHLLMTDVVMPEMNGRDLAQSILSIYPRLKCLFMSGYTANVIAHHGILYEGVNFIQKPFSLRDLATKVREALERN